jgi:hypothetical protein
VRVEGGRSEMAAATDADPKHIHKVSVGPADDSVGGRKCKNELGNDVGADASSIGDAGSERAIRAVGPQARREAIVGMARPVGAVKEPE